VTLMNGFAPSEGEDFELFSGNLTGNFTQINLPSLANGLSWDTSNLYTSGEISVVPEPSTFSLLAAAALGLLAYAWRRRRLFGIVEPVWRARCFLLVMLLVVASGNAIGQQYSLTDLGTVPGYTAASEAEGINSSGQVVGFASAASGAAHPSLYSGGTMTDLGALI